MKIHLNTPENKEVFGQNIGTWNISKSFKTIGTILGFSTELAVLYFAIVAHIAALLPFMYVNYACAGLAVYIAYKLAKERINTGRQAAKIIVSKEARQLGKWANVAVIISFLVVFGVSVALSWLGAVQGINATLPALQSVNTAVEDSSVIAYQQSANMQYKADSAAIRNNYNQIKSATKKEYNTKIAPWQRKKREDTTPAGQKWAKQQIQKLEEERDSKLNALDAEKNMKLADLKTTTRANIQVFESQTAEKKQLKISSATASHNRQTWYADKAGIILPIVISLSLVLLAVGLYLEEVFKQKAGIEEVALPNKYDLLPSLGDELKEAAQIVGGSWARSAINALKGLKSNPEIDKSMDALIELKLNEYKKEVHHIGNNTEMPETGTQNTQKPAKIGFKMPEKQPKTPENTYKTPENPEITPENPKPGAHLRRIFNKKGVGETFYPEQEPIKPAFPDENPGTGKIITLDFAARQMATWKSHLKNGTRTPEKAGPLYKYWSFIFDEMKTKGLASMQVPVFTPDEWQ